MAFENTTIISLEISLSLYHLLIIDLINRSYYQYFLPCQDRDEDTIQCYPIPCVNLKTLEGWKDFQVKGDVLLTEDDFTSLEPSRILKACHVVERKYSKQDLVAIYQAIGGYVFIHSKINILPMTFGMHIAWDRGLRDKGGKEGEREGKGGNSGRGGNDGKGRDDGAGKDRGQDGGPSELGDLPHEGMVTHCAVMEEVSSTFANDGSAHFDGVVVDHPRPISTASMTEAQSIAAVWRNPHNVLPNHPHPLRYYLPLWNKLGNGFAKLFLHWISSTVQAVQVLEVMWGRTRI
ncbi:hypothetical protein F5879DRAFT_918378 [Lentinula edodes]|nr:hypothetical protein F5879DRAFT_918378 [Lentinula edodes]